MSDAMDKARNPERPPYQPVLSTSRDFEDDLNELRAAATRDTAGDTGLFRLAFEHTGRQMVLRSLTGEEIAWLGLRVMVSGGPALREEPASPPPESRFECRGCEGWFTNPPDWFNEDGDIMLCEACGAAWRRVEHVFGGVRE